MKRLLPYILFALAFHAVILNSNLSWLKLTPGLTPAAKSLSITLSAAIPGKTPQKQLKPPLNERPRPKPVARPAAPQVENSTPSAKPLPAAPPEKRVQKVRPKTSLKALSYKKLPIKTSEVVPPAAIDQFYFPLEERPKILEPLGSEPKPSRVSDGPSKTTTTAAVQQAKQSENPPSGSILKIARPLYKQNPSPPYPRKARRLGYEGIVMLKVLIDETGRVDDLALVKSSGYDILDRAALASVKNWLFEPGTRGGVKKKMWVKIPIRFQLK